MKTLGRATVPFKLLPFKSKWPPRNQKHSIYSNSHREVAVGNKFSTQADEEHIMLMKNLI